MFFIKLRHIHAPVKFTSWVYWKSIDNKSDMKQHGMPQVKLTVMASTNIMIAAMSIDLFSGQLHSLQ